MRKSTLLLITGFALGFGLGFFVWQKQIGDRLREENARLREQTKDAEKLRSENAKLESERVDPDELKRLRDAQTDLLRLRGQVSQLKREADAARAAASRATTAAPPIPTDAATQPPIDTFTAKATGTVGKGQSMVTGGWKTESGKRVFVVMQPTPVEADNTVLVRSHVVEVPEQLVATLGLDGLKPDNTTSTGSSVLSAEDTTRLLANLKSQEGVNILSAPQVITANGRQAQVSVTESRELANGTIYSVGPVVSLTPTISDNKQQVELSVDAQLNLSKSPR